MLKMPVLVLSTALAVGAALATASDAHQRPAPLAIAPSAPDGDILLVQYGPGAWTVLDQQDIAIGRAGSNRQGCGTLMGIARRCERCPNRQRRRKDEYRHFQHLRPPSLATWPECYP